MKQKVTRFALTLLVMMLTTATAWADDPAWLKQGDSWDATTSTLTVNTATVAQCAYWYNNVIENVIISNSVTSIGANAFFGCTNLKTVFVSNDVTSIGDGAFYNCTNLKTVFVGNGVTSIGDGVFYNCTNLKTVIMTRTSSAPSLSGNPFANTPNLKIYVPVGNNGNILQAYRQNFGWSNYYNNDYLIGSWLSGTCAAGLKDGLLTVVGFGAFENCIGDNSRPNINSIVIEEGVTSIGEYAFSGCGNLATITVDANNQTFDSPEGSNAIIRKVDNTLILGCKTTVIPASVTSIGASAFYGCSGLTTISIPDGVTSIGDQAFFGCSGLTTVSIPDGVQSIGYNAFGACSNLESVHIGSGVSSIAESAFNDCDKLATITVDTGNQTFDSREGCNAIIRKTDNALVAGCKTTVIPNSVTNIGDMAFWNHDGLTSITIPNSVQSIGISAFYWCKGLSTVTIGSGVTSIGDGAFASCDALESVTIYATSVPTLGSDVFWDNKSGRKFYVFSDCVDAYKAAWGTYANDVEAIAPKASGTCGAAGNEANVTWQVAGEAGHYRLIISGTGDMAEYASANEVPWKDYLASITTAAISAGVTTINNNDFIGCTNLTSVTLYGAVTIGSDAIPATATVTIANGLYLHNGTEVLSGTITDMTKVNGKTLVNQLTYTDDNGDPQTTSIDWATQSTGDSESDPYIIYNKDQLLLLAYRVNGTHGETANDYENKYFKLGADIAFTYDPNETADYDENYEGIGGYYNSDIRKFNGNFNGDGHTVSGIRLRKTGTDIANDYQGLFGEIGSNAIIHDIHVTDARIKGKLCVGGIVGYSNEGTVRNCTVTESDITATTDHYGTICGFNCQGIFSHNYYRHCTVNGTANATNVGCMGADITDTQGAIPAFLVTLGDDATIETAMAADLGFSYGGKNYWRTGAELTLGHANRDGYTFSGYTVNGTPIEGSMLTMPASDVTVNLAFDVIDWATQSTGDSESDPYIIYNKDQLDLLATNVNAGNRYSGKYFKLGNDITYSHTTDWDDASSTENNYTAIGGYFNSTNCPFMGTFDGDGHTISGIRIYKGGNENDVDEYLGLFGLVQSGTVKNVTITDMRITGYYCLGGIVGDNDDYSRVENCHATATVALNAVQNGAYNFGGIVGYNYQGNIIGCFSAVTITTTGTLTNCHNFGGIVGYTHYGNLRNCLAVGVAIPDISFKDYYQNDVTASGAIAGSFDGGANFQNYYSGCTLGGTPTASGIGVGWEYSNNERHDVTANNGAVPATLHTLTLGEDITASGVLINQSGTISIPSGSTVVLSYSGSLSANQIAVFSLNSTALGGNSFIMPAANATVSASTATAWGIDGGADGSAAKPYVISRPAELDLLATNVNGGNDYESQYFVLANDIAYNPNGVDANGENYTAIGDYYSHPFKGTFDGQGYTISGIRINSGNNYQGLFGIVYGTVKNITLADASITGVDYVGGIASMNNGTIENCLVIGTSVCTTNDNGNGGVIVGDNWSSNLSHNYYSDCKLNGGNSNIGTDGGDVNQNDGAVYAIILSETEAMPTMYQNDKVVFRRSFTKDVASTVCLPFGIDATQAAAAGKFYTFAGVDKSGSEWEVIMQEANPSVDPPVAGNEATALTANTPYLFMPAATGPVLFYGEVPATVSAGETSDGEGWTFRGTYEKRQWDDTHNTDEIGRIYGFAARAATSTAESGSHNIQAGNFIRIAGGPNSYALPFRAYLKYEPVVQNAPRRTASELPATMTVRLVSNIGGTTAVTEMRNKELGKINDGWFTLDGRKLDGKPSAKGVYINNGRKTVIK